MKFVWPWYCEVVGMHVVGVAMRLALLGAVDQVEPQDTEPGLSAGAFALQSP